MGGPGGDEQDVPGDQVQVHHPYMPGDQVQVPGVLQVELPFDVLQVQVLPGGAEARRQLAEVKDSEAEGLTR